MNKADLVVLIAEKARIRKAAAERAINTFIGAIRETLARGEKFTISGFGSFSVSRRKARKGRNPKTGQEIMIPRTETIRFKASGKMKKRLV